MDTPSRKDDIFGSIGAAVLLIGTATGSAKAMVILSGTVLVLMLVFGRKPQWPIRGNDIRGTGHDADADH